MQPLRRTTLALVTFTTLHVATADVATVKVYADQCAVCHGADGKGQTPMGKKLKVSDWGDGKTLDRMTDTALASEIRVGKLAMPGYPKLDDDQLKAMVEYVRSFQKQPGQRPAGSSVER